MKAWFKILPLQNKVGIITWTFGNYVELWCEENQDWYIRYVDEIEIINKNNVCN